MERNPQRRLNSALPMKSLNVGALPAAPPRPAPTVGEGIARGGSEKVTTTPAINGNMKRQQTGEPHPYIHGQTVDDAPNTVKSYEGSIPVHPGMSEASKAAVHPVANDPKAVLADASRLGRPPEKA